MENLRVIIIHGTFGAPDENWFPWLASQVSTLGVETLRPTMPTPEGQSLESWRAAFRRQARRIDSNTILVGHSLAPAFILDLLQSAEEPVRGSFLVSGFLGLLGLPEFDELNETFVCRDDLNWPRIRENAGRVFVYNSDNDPYVPLDRGEHLADNLGVELRVVPGAGHINASAGYTEFPLLFNDLSALISE